ncbi:hypothetical protein FOMPIDRAFT_1053039 [Fomitopsis schrenkii]|uniref:DUF6534 domain-containing protein n=1 Tax=Fomitopsis schrenkii TaxID=2126942 RepID=S8DVM1_FOMSC|nr:hypothetical protein FOMPIDRAFT_1053039 [Fomitopsis schrenkii]
MSSPHLTLNATLGCIFIGIVFEVLLYSLSCAQTQYYFYEYRSDKLQLRALVAFLWALDTARTILDIQYIWLCIVTNHANPTALTFKLPPVFTAEFMLSSVTVFVVQIYFIRAIWRFLPTAWYRMPLIGTVLILASLSFAGGCVTVGEFTRDAQFDAVLEHSKVTASMQTITAFIVDLYIAVALSVILRGKKTGFSNTDTLVGRLVAYAIYRGLFTAVLQLLHFVTYVSTLNAGASKLIWSVFHFPASKGIFLAVYVNSLLALLNVRHWLRESHSSDAVRLESLRGGIQVQRTGELWRSIIRTDPGVLVTTETQIMQDEDRRRQHAEQDADPDNKVVI